MPNRSKAIKSLFHRGIGIFLLLVLSACQSSPSNAVRQSNAFYINDKDSILLNATSWTILTYGHELYLDSKTKDYVDAEISGSQVAVLTHNIADGIISTTDTFNAWGIGDNNMGILLTLFFSKVDDEFVYSDLTFEIGTKMATKLSAFTASGLVDTYFNDPTIPYFDYDLRLISLYFGILEYLYLNVYEYSSYNYNSFMGEYLSLQYEYIGKIDAKPTAAPLPTWVVFLIIIGTIVLAFGPGRYILPFLFFGSKGGSSNNRGGGGRSGGYWFRK